MELEIRKARSNEDRLAGVRRSRLAFGPADAVALVADANRLKSPVRARATTWLALVDGEPVAALLQYELVLRRGDEVRPAFGLGSVTTDVTFRKRGIATRLCSEVARNHGGAGLLFSAIDPGLYQRLGYVAVPAWDWRSKNLEELAGSGPRASLAPLDPRREVERLAAAWRRAHTGWYLDRDDERWAGTLVCNPDDIWFAVGDDGYVRLLIDEDGLEIAELCVRPEDRDATMRAAAALAIEAGADQVLGWFEPTDLVRAQFHDEGRAKTLPMLSGTDAPQTARFSSADYF